MKKYVIVTLILLMVLSTTACTVVNRDNLFLESIYYSINDDNNKGRAFCYRNGQKVDEEIEFDGLYDITEVSTYKNKIHCFAKDNNGITYALRYEKGALQKIKLPKKIRELNNICFYKEMPVFMTVDLQSKEALFYLLDFENNECVLLFNANNEDCFPSYYFSVNDKIVMVYANSEMMVDSENSYISLGKLCYYDGKMNEIGSGFAPMEYKGNVLYSVSDKSGTKTMEYNFKTQKSTDSDIKYLSSVINQSNYFDIRLININDEYVVCNDFYNLYCWKINKGRIIKLKHLSDSIFSSCDK